MSVPPPRSSHQRIGTALSPRCAECGRRIKANSGHNFDGRIYGPECVQRVIDRKNSLGKSE